MCLGAGGHHRRSRLDQARSHQRGTHFRGSRSTHRKNQIGRDLLPRGRAHWLIQDQYRISRSRRLQDFIPLARLRDLRDLVS